MGAQQKLETREHVKTELTEITAEQDAKKIRTEQEQLSVELLAAFREGQQV